MNQKFRTLSYKIVWNDFQQSLYFLIKILYKVLISFEPTLVSQASGGEVVSTTTEGYQKV